MPNQTSPVARTTITLSITVEDKKELKRMAVERDTSASALLHEWINQEQTATYKRTAERQ